MTDYKFSILSSDESPSAKIKQLRDDESSIVAANNKLIGEIWDVEAALNADGLTEPKKLALEEQRQELLNEIASAAYPEKIQELRNKIEELEIAVYGFSNINSDSPTENNHCDIAS